MVNGEGGMVKRGRKVWLPAKVPVHGAGLGVAVIVVKKWTTEKPALARTIIAALRIAGQLQWHLG